MARTSEGVSADCTTSLSCVNIDGRESNVCKSADAGCATRVLPVSATGEGTVAIKSNDIISEAEVACALGRAAEEGSSCSALEGDGAGVFPPPIRLLEHVALGGMFR